MIIERKKNKLSKLVNKKVKKEKEIQETQQLLSELGYKNEHDFLKRQEKIKKELQKYTHHQKVKTSSFIANAQLYGMPDAVEGGLGEEHSYCVEIIVDNKVGYAKMIEGKVNIVQSELECSYFLKEDAERLKKDAQKYIKSDAINIISKAIRYSLSTYRY